MFLLLKTSGFTVNYKLFFIFGQRNETSIFSRFVGVEFATYSNVTMWNTLYMITGRQGS